MPIMKQLEVSSLCLDLHNFRTVPQKNEHHAIATMISISPDMFWALLESLLEDGYHATENIILLETNGKYTVKEGNRRIAALKIVLGYAKNIDIPNGIRDKIMNITDEWKRENMRVPCSIYKSSESLTVDKIISLIHAKGEKAGRDKWTAVARARHNRDQKGQSEPGLDLLEKYLKHGKNLSETQAERWSGDYHLTVLDEALQKIYPHMEYCSVGELSTTYPKKHKSIIDKMLYDVGIQNLGFKNVRDTQIFFGNRYGVSIATPPSTPPPQPQSPSDKTDGPTPPPEKGPTKGSPPKPIAPASNDPKSVYKKLRSFSPRGNGREKLVTLLEEIKKLRIGDHPHAFCFLLRSMFEISAKAYCADHKSADGPKPSKSDGQDKYLVELLREITTHLTKNKTDKAEVKILHGAMTEISKQEGLLSVTSMNQLIHNPSFSVSPSDICILFGNIFPMLEEMNK